MSKAGFYKTFTGIAVAVFMLSAAAGALGVQQQVYAQEVNQDQEVAGGEPTASETRETRKKAKRKARRMKKLKGRIAAAQAEIAALRDRIKKAEQRLNQRPGVWRGVATGNTVITHTSTEASHFSPSAWINPPGNVPSGALVTSLSWTFTPNYLPNSVAYGMAAFIQAQSHAATNGGYRLPAISGLDAFASPRGILTLRDSSLSAAQSFRLLYAFTIDRDVGDWKRRVPFEAFQSGNITIGNQSLAVSYRY